MYRIMHPPELYTYAFFVQMQFDGPLEVTLDRTQRLLDTEWVKPFKFPDALLSWGRWTVLFSFHTMMSAITIHEQGQVSHWAWIKGFSL